MSHCSCDFPSQNVMHVTCMLHLKTIELHEVANMHVWMSMYMHVSCNMHGFGTFSMHVACMLHVCCMTNHVFACCITLLQHACFYFYTMHVTLLSHYYNMYMTLL